MSGVGFGDEFYANHKQCEKHLLEIYLYGISFDEEMPCLYLYKLHCLLQLAEQERHRQNFVLLELDCLDNIYFYHYIIEVAEI